MKQFLFAGATAVVTGAAGGIGEALTVGLADRGTHLVLLDRDGDGLQRVAAAVTARHPSLRVDTVLVDLSDPAATDRTARQVALDHPETTLLINNAGVALGGTFAQVTEEEFDWLLQINLGAVVTLTRHLLPVLRTHRGAHLVTVSSVLGLFALGGQTAYVTSKFAVRGFTEALRQEVAGDGVGVTCVHPGGIATGIARSARISAGAALDPAYEHAGREADAVLTIPATVAAAAILRGVERRRPRVLIGANARLPDLLVRLLPGGYGRIVTLVVAHGRSRLSR